MQKSKTSCARSTAFECAADRFPICATLRGLAALIVAMASASVQAQELEPRTYSNAPIGLNFLIAGYAYAEGQLAFDPALPVADAEFRSNSGVIAYVRAFDAWGKSAKLDIVLPYSSFSAHGLLAGQPRQREMSGWADPLIRLSTNFYGAPALAMKDYASYRQDLIVGASFQVSAPLGQYDHEKLLNLGNNRWSFKPELGISKALGPWTNEVTLSARFFTDNNDFNNGRKLSQAPVYSIQTHVTYSFPSGIWMSLGGTWFTGGRTTIDGVRTNTLQSNTRAGLTVSLPVDRRNSVKLYASTGISSRTGSDFDAVGIAWQYRWGAGL